jgi:hypothetical protein
MINKISKLLFNKSQALNGLFNRISVAYQLRLLVQYL